MIHSKTNNYGIDSKIYLLQRYIDAHLNDVWNVTLNVYGRIQDTTRDGQTIPEVYDNSKDYIQPFFNDSQPVTVGFFVKNREVLTGKHRANIDIVFVVRLNDLHGNAYRDDEKVLMQTYRELVRCGLILDITGIKTGINEVFTGYATDNVLYRDMQPWFVYSFECQIDYNDNVC